ncbi:uncharacterized protein C8orf34 homolog isoform X2 [Ylistrum balloti]|uniref:uncharacterized protein C8orf34 homolog isoform X2 n=1 Tax=Ylistrum balloti TaxID=509963 RepID=UPI002905BD24|nr:uncharacterized protein C8orf34 homolog isoform X2 [Ylistrum balloti]
MGTPQKMQHYMERHRLSSLFEDLMNKVLHDQPEKPLIYMIKVLYKKAGMDIPTDLKLAGVRRSSPERIMQRSKSPEMTRKAATQAWTSKSVDVSNRGYEKPWQTHSKKPKAKEVDHEEPTKPGRKQKPPGWNADNKVGFSSFDEMFEDTPGKSGSSKQKKKTDPFAGDIGKAWASTGLDDDNVQYQSNKYKGPRTNRKDDDDPLAGEIMNEKKQNITEETVKIANTSRVRGRHVDAKSHRKELEQMITEESKDDSGYGEVEMDNEQDDAIELLEDGEELRKEGARNISKTGYKLSRIMRERQQEANVKLNINLYTGPQPTDSFVADTLYEDNQERYYESDDDRPPTGLSGYRDSPGDSDVDDEFESVSQVTGPRRPVWNVMDSDGESFIPKASKTLPEPSRSRSSKTDRFASSVPSKAYASQSMESADSFLQAGKTWTPGRETERKDGPDSIVGDSLKSDRGGWSLPKYESDASILDWSTTGKSVDRGKHPKAY